ncbi:MAG TPA: hypothetical protein VNE38_18515 [Ktedonobacteraceae bacterium]|nr:hypothetical protein [Ktedonobacteraceae bacterium]
MDYQTYQVALSPDLDITPEEFASAWNEGSETRDLATAHFSEENASQFIDPMLVAALLSIPATVTSSVIYDLIKDVIQRLRQGKGAQGHNDHKHIHIEQTKKPDGTRILVIDIDEL